MKRLTKKSHWSSNSYYGSSLFAVERFVPSSFRSVHLKSILRQYVRPGQSILEIGVAPGLHLIGLAQEFRLDPHGLDYSAEGVRATRKNFVAAGFNPRAVVQADLFDANVRRRFAGKFDVVYSAGFIEHFDDTRAVLEYHRQLVKPGGLLIVTIPNLRYMARFLPPDVLAVHNRSIMYPAVVRKAVPKGMKILRCGYFGGLLNVGLVYAKNPWLERMRLVVYGMQRLVLDQVQRLLLLATIVIQPPVLTPDIIIIARNGNG